MSVEMESDECQVIVMDRYDMIFDPIYFNLCRAGAFAILLFFVSVCFIFFTV